MIQANVFQERQNSSEDSCHMWMIQAKVFQQRQNSSGEYCHTWMIQAKVFQQRQNSSGEYCHTWMIQAKVFQQRQNSSEDSCHVWITEVLFSRPTRRLILCQLSQLIVKLHLFRHCIVHHGVCTGVYATVSTQTWVLYTGLFLELSFSKSGGVHDKLHISSSDWWDLNYFPWHRHQIEGTDGFYCLIQKTLANRGKRNSESSEAKLPQRDSNPGLQVSVFVSIQDCHSSVVQCAVCKWHGLSRCPYDLRFYQFHTETRLS